MNTLTKKPSLAALIESTNIPASLVRAVVRQMGGWESFTQSAPDITRHGIDGGFSGFTYYSDTIPFFKAHRADITSQVERMADELGEVPVELVSNFRCLGGQGLRFSGETEHENARRKSVAEYGMSVIRCLGGGRLREDDTQVANALAWYAGEEVARAYCDAFDPQ